MAEMGSSQWHGEDDSHQGDCYLSCFLYFYFILNIELTVPQGDDAPFALLYIQKAAYNTYMTLTKSIMN